MNEIIKVNYDNEQPTVSGRVLHTFLEVGTAYKDWFPRMCEYGFTEGLDFCSFLSESTGGRPATEHALTIPMAKEIAMLQRNEKGKQARQYFIQVEKDWNSPEKIMARALQIADMTIKSLQLENNKKDQLIGELKPRADYTDKILKSKGTMNINAIAKDYGMSGNMMNKKLHELKVQYCQDRQWLLYAKHQGKGYTHSQTIDFERKDGTPDTRLHTQWTQKGRLFLYELLKANGILPMIERTSKSA